MKTAPQTFSVASSSTRPRTRVDHRDEAKRSPVKQNLDVLALASPIRTTRLTHCATLLENALLWHERQSNKKARGVGNRPIDRQSVVRVSRVWRCLCSPNSQKALRRGNRLGSPSLPACHGEEAKTEWLEYWRFEAIHMTGAPQGGYHGLSRWPICKAKHVAPLCCCLAVLATETRGVTQVQTGVSFDLRSGALIWGYDWRKLTGACRSIVAIAPGSGRRPPSFQSPLSRNSEWLRGENRSNLIAAGHNQT